MNLRVTTVDEDVVNPPSSQPDISRLASLLKLVVLQVRAFFPLIRTRLGRKLLILMIGAVLVGAYLIVSLWMAFESPPEVQLSHWWWCALSALVGLIALFCLLASTVRAIVQPVIELTQKAREIGTGHLGRPIEMETNNEIAELASAVDRVRHQLRAEHGEKEQLSYKLRMLNEIALATYQMLDPQEILDFTLETAISSLGVEAGAIYLRDPEHTGYSLHACRGIPQCRNLACDVRALNHTLSNDAHTEVHAVSLNAATVRGSLATGQSLEGRSFIAVPLKARGTSIGAITLITRIGQAMTDEGARTLGALGEEIGLALANVVHFQNVRYRATLEERERLAREMHDSLAQALGYLKLKASITDDLLSGGEIAEARTNLRQVQEIAGQTYFDVRETIFGLRRSNSHGAEFLSSLEEYLRDYQTYYGMSVKLQLENGFSPTFPLESTVQLSRIIQEALTNVRKHARASQACLRFGREDGHWRVTIEDDGLGFDPSQALQPERPFFGLQIMRERAESISGTLEIQSRAGGGTRVIITLPAGQE